MIDRFGPGVGHLNYVAVPGVGIFEFLFVPVTTNHFPGGEFQLYLTSHFCPGVGNLTAICWKMSKSRPMPRLHPRRLDIDSCITLNKIRSIFCHKNGYYPYKTIFPIIRQRKVEISKLKRILLPLHSPAFGRHV